MLAHHCLAGCFAKCSSPHPPCFEVKVQEGFKPLHNIGGCDILGTFESCAVHTLYPGALLPECEESWRISIDSRVHNKDDVAAQGNKPLKNL